MGRSMTSIRLKYIHEFRDRHGRVRRYVRRKGLPQVALPGLPGSPEFMSIYKDAIAGASMPSGRHKPGTLGDLVARYYGSVEFANLKASSQATYRFVLSRHVEQDGHRLANDLPIEKARKVIEEIGATRPGMANLSRAVLVAVFEFAIDIGWRKDNPFKRVKPYRLGTRHTWTDEQLVTYERRWLLGTRERLAYDVLLFTGQRVGDAVKLKRSVKAFKVEQEKTGARLTIPIHPALARSIKATPANGIYLIGDARGRPIIGDTLSRIIKGAAGKAGLPPECVAHGLRKALLRRLAERKATTKGIAAVSGHRTLKEVERYTADADQATLAEQAIALLPDEG